jgi:hypothetical protein
MTDNTTTIEARRQAAAVARVTGEHWCQHGGHSTKAPLSMRRGRTICERCVEKIRGYQKQQRGAK